jgi:hypothetical protein
MKSLVCIVFTCALVIGTVPSLAADKPETSHLAFVKEYIRELTAVESLRASSQKQLDQSEDRQSFSKAIDSFTTVQLELRSQIAVLETMRLSAPFDDLIPRLISIYEEKISLYQRLIDISSEALVDVPKPGLDYNQLAAEVPKLRAQMDTADHVLFDAVPLAFATLIDQRRDSDHLSHLSITNAERDELIASLTGIFGAKLVQNDQKYTVGAAAVLLSGLRGGHKSVADPGE